MKVIEEEIPANPTRFLKRSRASWDASHRCNQLPASIKHRERCTPGGQRGLRRNKVGAPVLLDVIMTAVITRSIAIMAALLLFAALLAAMEGPSVWALGP